MNDLEERVRKRNKALEKQNETIMELTAEKQKIETSLYETKAKLEKKKLDKSTLKQDYHQLQVELNMAKESYQVLKYTFSLNQINLNRQFVMRIFRRFHDSRRNRKTRKSEP